ncbi:MAG TPA: hypothetical protein VNI02_12155 [Blastocatellia bacterium]|jgi:hypothetical protein|nr:hypothetical protein [Blastocatellia bacterium]
MRLITRIIKSSLTALLLIICVSASGQVEVRKDEGGNTPAKSRFEVRKDKDGFLEGRNFKSGSVWIVLFVRTLPGKDTVYFNYLADAWKRQQEVLKQEGVVLSYKILQTNQIHKDDFNVLVMTEYKSRASIDENQGKLDSVVRQVVGKDEVAMAAYRERETVRRVFGGKICREIIFR